jgi:hypothetical protein
MVDYLASPEYRSQLVSDTSNHCLNQKYSLPLHLIVLPSPPYLGTRKGGLSMVAIVQIRIRNRLPPSLLTISSMEG